MRNVQWKRLHCQRSRCRISDYTMSLRRYCFSCLQIYFSCHLYVIRPGDIWFFIYILRALPEQISLTPQASSTNLSFSKSTVLSNKHECPDGDERPSTQIQRDLLGLAKPLNYFRPPRNWLLLWLVRTNSSRLFLFVIKTFFSTEMLPVWFISSVHQGWVVYISPWLLQLSWSNTTYQSAPLCPKWTACSTTST